MCVFTRMNDISPLAFHLPPSDFRPPSHSSLSLSDPSSLTPSLSSFLLISLLFHLSRSSFFSFSLLFPLSLLSLFLLFLLSSFFLLSLFSYALRLSLLYSLLLLCLSFLHFPSCLNSSLPTYPSLYLPALSPIHLGD